MYQIYESKKEPVKIRCKTLFQVERGSSENTTGHAIGTDNESACEVKGEKKKRNQNTYMFELLS